jgi:hypothetical protein
MLKIMKKTVLSYSAPQIDIFEVVAECGYSVSTGTTLPGFGSEEDELIY